MLTAAERESSLEALGAFTSAVHAHIEARAKEQEDTGEGSDPRVRDFLEQHFPPESTTLPIAAWVNDRALQNAAGARGGGGFDSDEKVFTFLADDIAKDLPADLRKLFMALPAEERDFLLTMDKKYRTPYTHMTVEEQAFFRALKTPERNGYIAMNPDERGFFRQLDPANRPFYLVLGTGHRTLLRSRSPEALEAFLTSIRANIAEEAAKPAMDVAREISAELVGKQGTADVRQAAQRVIVNFLNEHPGDRRTAFIGSLQTLLGSNQNFLDALLREVGERLSAAQKEAQPACDFTSHFMKARHWVQSLSLQLVHAEVTREELIEGLVQSLIASARFTTAHLPQKKSGGMDANLLLRRPIMG